MCAGDNIASILRIAKRATVTMCLLSVLALRFLAAFLF